MNEAILYGGYAVMALTVIVHVALGYAIWVNAAERERENKPLMYVGSNIWGLATLLTGIFGVVTYWFIHHSALRKLYGKDDEAEASPRGRGG